MSLHRLSFVLIALALAAPVAALAAQPARASVRDPGEPRASVPPVRYESAFARYRPNAEAEVRPWREQNDHVGRIGGWRVYGREAIVESPAGGAAPDAKPAEGATGHHAHPPKAAR